MGEVSPILAEHEENEERFVYDKVVQDSGNSQIKRFHAQHEEQVREATRMIKDIDRMQADDDDRFLTQVRELHRALEEHIEMEEGDFWPQIRSVWDEHKLDDAGEEVERAAGSAAARSR